MTTDGSIIAASNCTGHPASSGGWQLEEKRALACGEHRYAAGGLVQQRNGAELKGVTCGKH